MVSSLEKLERLLGKEARKQVINEAKDAFPDMKKQVFLGNSEIREFWFNRISKVNKSFLKEWLKENRMELNKQIERELEDLGNTLTHRILNEQEIENCKKVMKIIFENPSIDHIGYADIYNGKWHYTDLAQRVRDLKVANKMLEELEGIHFRIIKKHFESLSGKNVKKELKGLRAKKNYYKSRIAEKLKRREQIHYM